MLVEPPQKKPPAIVEGLTYKIRNSMKFDQWASAAIAAISILVTVGIYQQQVNSSNQKDLQTLLERMARMETSIEFIKDAIDK